MVLENIDRQDNNYLGGNLSLYTEPEIIKS